MTGLDVTELLGNGWVLLGGLVPALLTLVWLVRRVRKIVRSERPDDALSTLGMLVGFGWSSEAVWILTGPDGADLWTPIRIALFAVFEIILIVFMIRAKRNVREIGHPGRAGRNAWCVAAGMSLVAVWTANNLGEAFLRLLVPVLLTSMWWHGIVGEDPARRPKWATSWRWTPRRLLLWLGAIEPGERDVESVHRERLTQQMTNLEFARQHGPEKKRDRAAAKLMRLGLTADDDIIGAVRDRVARATWFEAAQSEAVEQAPESAPRPGVPEREAARRRTARVRHRGLRRRVCMAHPRQVITPAQTERQDDRSAQERELVVCAIKETHPALPQRQIARLAGVPPTTVRQLLRRTKTTEAAQDKPINGAVPDLEGVR
jgi:hypothetical protein